jgi:hypothetical protein
MGAKDCGEHRQAAGAGVPVLQAIALERVMLE